MKETIGTIRKFDKEGRITIPSDIRRLLKVDELQIKLVKTNGEYIVELRKVK